MKRQISQDQYNRLSNNILLDYVKDATPVVWHQMAMEWDYDADNTFFDWLINNPETDKATALLIYWMSSPYYTKQFNNAIEVQEKQSWYIDDFNFIETLESKLLNGFFTVQDFAFDPKSYSGTDWTKVPQELKLVRQISSVLFQALQGQKVSRSINFIEGIPTDVQDQWEKLTDEYEIV